jgi:hypothetical protein
VRAAPLQTLRAGRGGRLVGHGRGCSELGAQPRAKAAVCEHPPPPTKGAPRSLISAALAALASAALARSPLVLKKSTTLRPPSHASFDPQPAGGKTPYS